MPNGYLYASRIGQTDEQHVIPKAIDKRFVVDNGVDKTLQRIERSPCTTQNLAKSLDIRLGPGMRAVRHVRDDQIVPHKLGILGRIVPFKPAKRPDAHRGIIQPARIFDPGGIAIGIRPVRPRFARLRP